VRSGREGFRADDLRAPSEVLEIMQAGRKAPGALGGKTAEAPIPRHERSKAVRGRGGDNFLKMFKGKEKGRKGEGKSVKFTKRNDNTQ